MARDKLLYLYNTPDHSCHFYGIGSEYSLGFYLDMTDATMAYIDGDVLFVDIQKMFDRYPEALAIRIADGINFLNYSSFFETTVDEHHTFIFDKSLYASLAYSVEIASPAVPLPDLMVYYAPNVRSFIVRSPEQEYGMFSLDDYLNNGSCASTFEINGIVYAVVLSENKISMSPPYNGNFYLNMSYIPNELTGLEVPVTPSPVSSLNGNGCEFKDGTEVNVNGRDIIYKVLSSIYYLLEDNSYTVLYSLQSPTGETLNCPEAYLTRYIPVTTT